MSITIKDIAKEAGVSHTTVSRALRQHPAIALGTIARIQRIADELGYVPNTVARGLKTSRSGVLGVIVRRIDDPFFSEVLGGIEDVLYAGGYGLFLAASNREPKREEAIVRAMSERRVEGVIICSTRVGEEHRKHLGRFRVPAVLINNQAAEDIIYSIYHDDYFGCSRLTRHLLDLGHKRIAYLGNARAGRTTAERLGGFEGELTRARIPLRPEYVVNGPNGRVAGGAAGARQILDLPDRPTAIVCYNDMMAIGAIRALREAGLRVPEDCSVTGFDDIELAAYFNPPLTTFSQPRREMGRQAALMIMRLLAGQEDRKVAQSDILVLRGELRDRGSTAAIGEL